MIFVSSQNTKIQIENAKIYWEFLPLRTVDKRVYAETNLLSENSCHSFLCGEKKSILPAMKRLFYKRHFNTKTH